MLHYLTPYLYTLLGLQRDTRSQVLTRILCTPKGGVVYIKSDGCVQATSHIDESILESTDIVGLGFWRHSVFILTDDGSVYTEDGSVCQSGIKYMHASRGGGWLEMQTNTNEWLSEIDQWEYDFYDQPAKGIYLPSDVSAISSFRTGATCYIRNGKGYVRWYESRDLLAPHRTLLKLINRSDMNLFEVPLCSTHGYWTCRCSPFVDQEVLFLGDMILTVVELEGEYRECSGEDPRQREEMFAVESLNQTHFIFDTPIADAQFFFDTKPSDEPQSFLVLLEDGSLYLSENNTIIAFEKRVIAFNMTKDWCVVLLFEDDTIQQMSKFELLIC
jgi:hypothetical protein